MVAVYRPSRPPCTILAVAVHHFAVGYAPWGAVRVHFQAGVRTVVKELRELFGDQKLPSVQSLKQEKAQLTERKHAQYESYSAMRSQWLELSKLARNRDSIAGQAMLPERSNKKRTI